MQMAQLPPAPVFGEDLQMGAPHPHPLPEELVAKKCFWNPRTEDFSCFSWCIRAHLAEVHKLPGRRPETSNRLTDEVFYSVPPARGKYSKQAKRELEDFGLNWSTLPDPSQRGVCWTDIAEFERANERRPHPRPRVGLVSPGGGRQELLRAPSGARAYLRRAEAAA